MFYFVVLETDVKDVMTQQRQFVLYEWWIVSWNAPRLTSNGNDEFGNDRKDSGASVIQQVIDSLAGEALVWMSSLTQAVKE